MRARTLPLVTSVNRFLTSVHRINMPACAFEKVRSFRDVIAERIKTKMCNRLPSRNLLDLTAFDFMLRKTSKFTASYFEICSTCSSED